MIKKEKMGIYLLLLPLLTFCTNADNPKREPAKIEHITRKGISQQYSPKDFGTKPYIDTQEEEPLFNEKEFEAPSPIVENAPFLKDKIELQEDVDQLAKLKRAGRLSQKDYNARVAAIHSKNKPTPPKPKVEEATPKTELKKIEAIHIEPDDEIFFEE
jgi:hypothetical protein